MPPGAVPPTGPVRAEAGSRYDQQGRNGQGGRFGWLGELSLVVLLLFVAIVVATGVAAVLAAVLGVGPESADSEAFFEDPVADTAFQLVGIAIGIPVVLWGARYLGRRPAGTVSSVLGRLRWKWLGLCAAVAVPMIIVQFGIMIAWTWGEESAEPAGDGFPGWTAFLVSLAVLAALVPFQAAAEEYVFRGWLVQVIGRAVRSPWPAVVIASLLFALAHGFGELSGFILLFYSALWWGWLVIRTGGLEAVITMHAANNLLAFGIAAGFGELASTETAADAPWQAMVVEFVFAPLYCLVMARIADRRGVARVSPGAPAEAGAPEGPDALGAPEGSEVPAAVGAPGVPAVAGGPDAPAAVGGPPDDVRTPSAAPASGGPAGAVTEAVPPAPDPLTVLTGMYAAEAAYLAADEPGGASFDSLAAFFAPDAELHQADALPYGGTWHGHDGLARFFLAMGEVWETFERVEQEFLATGETSVVLTQVRARVRATGRELRFPILQTITVEDGRITEVRPFHWDTRAIADACAEPG